MQETYLRDRRLDDRRGDVAREREVDIAVVLLRLKVSGNCERVL
jgi:hypothetical protein